MERAFTLAELVLVIFVVIIISTALLGTFLTCIALNENSRMTTVAMNLARDVLEETVRNPNWDGIISESIPSTSSEGLGSYYGYKISCQVAVKNFPNDSSPTMKFVRVAVCWKSKEGRLAGSDVDLEGDVDSGEGRERWPTNLPDDDRMDVVASPVAISTAILRGY